MYQRIARGLALAGLGLFASLATAQQSDRPQQKDRPQADQSALFDRIDANKDGVVSADEVPEDRKSFFDRLLRTGDKDKNGKLTRDEFAAANQEQEPRRPATDQPAPQRPGPGNFNFDPERAFRFSDRNGDGKLTPEEVPEERRTMFKTNLSRADKDGDGALNLEEFKASMEAVARMMGRGPNPPGAGGPPNLANAPFFRAIDANKDGQLTAEELAKAGEALKTLDRNEDGILTPEELAPPGGPPGRLEQPRPSANPPQNENARAMLDRLKQMDTNGDGKLSREEAPDRLKANFERVDTNSDGFIDATEAARIFDRLRPKNEDGNSPRRRPQQDNKDKEKTDT